jgi:predicted PurR-regulated permease PerM
MTHQWSRPTKYLFTILILAAFIWLINIARPLIGPLVISALLAYVLNPAVSLLVKRTPLRRWWATLVVYSIFMAVVIAIPSTITPPIIRQITRFTSDLQRIEQQVIEFLAQPVVVGNITLYPGQSLAVSDLEQLIQDAIGPITSGAFNVIGSVTTNLVWVLIIIVTTYYLLKDAPKLQMWLVRLAPKHSQDDMTRLLKEIDRVWSIFLRGQIVLMLLVGILTGVLTGIVGLRGALVLGIVAGVMDVIPSLGPMIAGLIAMFIGLFLGSTYIPVSNFWFAMIVLGIFMLVQQIENIWLRPQIMGHSLDLHPAVVFVGVLGALAVFGVLGALIIIPTMSSIGIIGRYIRAKMVEEDPWKKIAPIKVTEGAVIEQPAPAEETEKRPTTTPQTATD